MPKWASEIFTYILIVLKHLWIISILSYYEIQLLVVLCIQMHFCIQLLCFTFILVQSDDYLKKLTQFDPSVKGKAITGGEVTLQAWPVKWHLIRMPQIITPLCYCRDVLDQRWEAEENVASILYSLLREHSANFFLFWLLMWAHCFHFYLEGQYVWNEGIAGWMYGNRLPGIIYSGLHQSGYQPLASCQPAISQ